MEVRELGEFGLIEMLTRMVTRGRVRQSPGADHEFGLVVDIGDDTAAWRCGQGTELATTDTAVEGVHFTRATTPWYDLGWKLIAANVSDIAAMGGLPLYSLVTLGLPPDTKVEDIKALYRGMLDLGDKYSTALVGGDVVRSPVIFVTVALNGVHSGDPMLRSCAAVGDEVAVTGFLGSSAGGLELMLEGIEASSEAATYLKVAHRRPEPCVSQGQLLSEHGVRTAMDISDGLVDDLGKLCSASGVSAVIQAQAVPLHHHLVEAFGQRSVELALWGGEDYQLLFTAPKKVMDSVLSLLGPGARVIGKIVDGEPGKVLVDGAGQPDREARGWDHFR